ncbi:hypothetical protein TWF281_004112 [Arthrobotrys megalospora]
MPRYALCLAVRTLSRGVGIRYIHLPPRILPISISQSRRTRIMPITPSVIRYANRRTYCDDLSGNSTFSGNWAYDLFDSEDVEDYDSSSSSSTNTSPSPPPPSFWSKLPDYSSAFQESQKKGKTHPASKSSFSDADLDMINKTAAAAIVTISSSSSKAAEEVPRIIQKTVGEITKDIKFPDPDVWGDSASSTDTPTSYATEFVTTGSTSSTIARDSRRLSSSPLKNV